MSDETNTAETLPTLTLEQILAADDIKRETVPMPEWGGAVVIQGLTKAQIDAIREAATVAKQGAGGKGVKEIDDTRFACGMLAASLVEPTMTPEQVKALDAKASAPVLRLQKRVLAISGLNPEAAAEAEKSAGA